MTTMPDPVQPPDTGFLIGVDIGGTRLKTGLVRPDGTVERPTVDATAGLPFAAVLELIVERVEGHVEAGGGTPMGLGVALPGIVEPRFGSRYLPGKVLGIEAFPLRDELSSRFGAPVRCVNDGTAATLAEWRFGVAKGIDDVVGLTLGTGLGSGVIIGGRLLQTANLGTGLSIRSEERRGGEEGRARWAAYH